ncbi:hypothetical protein [Pseudomonas allokribbensis]|uniref:hypothetical protein n=1 Tax=Pseudomonas allokribbensis TaxID=2774460 RepID=UPI001787CC71|nr:hypothetical protein [Pseudomonas allokribbensis]
MDLKFYYAYGGIHPVIGPVFYASAAALPDQADSQRYDLYVCSVLMAIAQIPSSCERIINAISSIEDGIESSIVEGGNDVLLYMDATGVQVDIQVNDDWIGQPQGRFTLKEWRKVLEQWKRLLEMPEDSQEVLMLSLP